MLDTRKETILRLIIEDYIQSAEPIGSKQLLDRHGLDISSATIRNEMFYLEQEGYLRQPHTSAGRIPTEKAYLYYLQFVVEPTDGRGRRAYAEPELINERAAEESFELTLRRIARQLVEISGETAIVAVDSRFGYYTGVSNLLRKPEFSNIDVLRSVSAMIDQFDDVVSQVYDLIKDETVVYIGSQNPFGNQITTIIVKYKLENSNDGLLGIVGPLRMNYGRNIALIEQAKEFIMETYG